MRSWAVGPISVIVAFGLGCGDDGTSDSGSGGGTTSGVALEGDFYGCMEGSCDRPVAHSLFFRFVDDPSSGRTIELGAIRFRPRIERLDLVLVPTSLDFSSSLPHPFPYSLTNGEIRFTWEEEEVRLGIQGAGDELWLTGSNGARGYFRRLGPAPELSRAYLSGQPLWEMPAFDHVAVYPAADIPTSDRMASLLRTTEAFVAQLWYFDARSDSAFLDRITRYPYHYRLRPGAPSSHAALVCVGVGTWDQPLSSTIEVTVERGGSPSRVNRWFPSRPQHYGQIWIDAGRIILQRRNSVDEAIDEGLLEYAQTPGATPETICQDLGVPPPGAGVLEPETW